MAEKRREYGTGTLREVRPRVWRLRAPAGVDPATGRTRLVSKQFHASKPANRGGRGEALDALRLLVQEVHEGQHAGTNATVGRLAVDFLEQVKRTRSPSTAESYRLKVEKTIVPAIGDVRLGDLTAHHLDRLYADLAANGIATTTINHTHAVISAMLGQAMRWGWLRENVAKSAQPPKPEPKQRAPLSPLDAVRLINHAAVVDDDQELATLVFLLCILGGRRGEACGLQWGDVDWDRRAVTIERQIVPVPGGQRVAPATKTGKRRIVAIGDVGVVLLHQYRNIIAHRIPGWQPKPDGWLVSVDGGVTPTRAHGVTGRVQSLGRRLDPPVDVQPHDFRRFSVTHLINHGVDLKTVRDRHGHSSLATTEIYALPVTESDEGAARVMGELLRGATLGR